MHNSNPLDNLAIPIFDPDCSCLVAMEMLFPESYLYFGKASTVPIQILETTFFTNAWLFGEGI
jgi:hypothetical protein